MSVIDADAILSTTPRDAARLLGDGPKEVRRAFHRLASEWHPDVCRDPRAGEVFAHLVGLRDALARTRPASPQRPDPAIRLETIDGRNIGMRPLGTTKGDLGHILVGRGTVTFLHDADNADLAAAEAAAIRSFRFADDRMRAEMSRFLPKIAREMQLKDGRAAIAVERCPDDVLLSDLLARGPMEPVHAAWLCSGLMNIAAWLAWSGMTHGAIDPRHILVSPAGHAVKLVGGWAFAANTGSRPTALPERTLAALPALALPGATLTPQTDLELVRLTVREAMGDPFGARLKGLGVPDPIRSWLTMPPTAGGIGDYGAWSVAIDKSWPRRFVQLDVTPEDIYGA